MNIQSYNEQQEAHHATRRELLARMTDKPFNTRHVDLDLDVELQQTEEWLLDNPPLYEIMDEDGQPTGHWKRRKTGLVEDVLFPQPRVANYPRDDFRIIPVNQWDDWLTGPDAVDLRPFVQFILDQNGVGSCASEAITQCIMILRAIGRQAAERLNPWFIYNTVSGGVDRGSSLPDNVNFVLKHGVPSQAVYGREHGWRQAPTADAQEDALKYKLLEVFRIRTWEEFGSCLLYGMPVFFGYSGHAITGVTVLSTTRVQYANSWSLTWGDKGFGTLSKNSIYWAYGVYGVRVVTRRREPSVGNPLALAV
jgi:hypothetical protein